MQHTLRIENLQKTINKTLIVKGINLYIKSSEIVGLLGPNGAGKTITFYMICGLIESSGGKVFLDNQNISFLPLHKRSQIGIGYLPQEASVFKDLTVEENLQIAADATDMSSQTKTQRLEKLLDDFNIEPIRSRKSIGLSGGERRRVEIARTLVRNPKFVLLDEPFAGVDPIAVSDIQKIIKKLVNLNIGILITDHNVRETLGICNRAYVIKSGELLASGSSEEIFNNELVIKHYLGETYNT